MSKYKKKNPEDREFRKPNLKERRKLKAFQKMLNKAKQSTDQNRAQAEVENRANALNESLVGLPADSKISDKTKEVLVICLAELAMFMAYLISILAVAVLIVLLIEPLMELETWLSALIDRGSVAFADRIVQIEHYQHRTEAFSSNIKDGIIGGTFLFLIFFFRRLIKGHWIHQE